MQQKAENPPNVPSKPYKQVLVCPGSLWINKQLPLEPLKELLALFHHQYRPTFHFLWGNPAELTVAEELQRAFPASELIPKLSLKELECKVASMDLVIGMDSFPLHLGRVLGIPTRGLSAPPRPLKYNPDRPRRPFLSGNLSLWKSV